MHAYLLSMGSMGDTLPFVLLGQTMKARGHDVTVVANGYYREFIEKAGLGFAETLSKDKYLAFVEKQKRQSDLRSLQDMGDLLIELIEPVYRFLESRYVPGETVACGQAYCLAARVAQERLGLPLATVHLQPMWFRSLHDMPPVNWMPRFLKSGIQNIIDFFCDRRVGKAIMDFREGFGLKRERRVMRGWWHSPTCQLGFFPDWFCPPQPDWPPNTHLTGFPIPALPDLSFDMTEVDAFLNAGDPPLVFTQSSIANEAHTYFQTSIEIAQRLDCRAIFLTPHPELLPSRIPDGMKYFPFVPLDRLLPRAKAHLHRGGIGTIAHTLMAGIPQVTVPMVYDQPSNCLFLNRLRVSIDLKPKEYRAAKVVPRLKELLGSAEVAERCRDYAERIRTSDPLARTSEILESLAVGRPN